MKKVVCMLVAVMLLAVCSGAVAAEPDYSKYSLDQLYKARSAINTEIAAKSANGKVIYKDKEVEIQWLGFDEKSFPGYLKANLLIQNKTKKSIYYEITGLALNNIQASLMNSFMQMEISAGMTYLTATNNMSVVDLSAYSAVGINSTSDIDDVYIEISFYKSGDIGAKVTKKVKETVHLPVTE